MHTYQQEFLVHAETCGALKFGQFELKSGRLSPYFFNAGAFSSGGDMALLGRCYAQAIVRVGLEFDVLFGPAYKGIPLVTSVAIALANEHGRDLPWCFNRKEAKTHGEGGQLVGAPLQGRVLIVDDVMTAGTAIREAIDIIRHAGAKPVAAAIALNRQERGAGDLSAAQEVAQAYDLQVLSIAKLDDLIAYLQQGQQNPATQQALAQAQAYRNEFGTAE